MKTEPPRTIDRDDKVTITIEGASIKVKPMHAVLKFKEDALKWVVQGLSAGRSVEVEFEVGYGKGSGGVVPVKGPFAPSGAGANPYRGRYSFEAGTSFPYATAVNDAAGYWKYTVTLREGTKDVAYLDPGVIVKNDY